MFKQEVLLSFVPSSGSNRNLFEWRVLEKWIRFGGCRLAQGRHQTGIRCAEEAWLSGGSAFAAIACPSLQARCRIAAALLRALVVIPGLLFKPNALL